MKTYIGIDPGGMKAFGWCVMEVTPPALSVRRIVTGVCSGVSDAVMDIEKALKFPPVAGGIDAPLYWVTDGDRKSDKKIRKAVAGNGGSSSTVSHVNSLRGACLVQGVLSAVGLSKKWPQIAITESHPKALLSIWPNAREFVRQYDFSTDHERDAALGAYSACALFSQWNGWVDLLDYEESYFAPSGGKVAYWFPRV